MAGALVQEMIRDRRPSNEGYGDDKKLERSRANRNGSSGALVTTPGPSVGRMLRVAGVMIGLAIAAEVASEALRRWGRGGRR